MICDPALAISRWIRLATMQHTRRRSCCRAEIEARMMPNLVAVCTSSVASGERRPPPVRGLLEVKGRVHSGLWHSHFSRKLIALERKLVAVATRKLCTPLHDSPLCLKELDHTSRVEHSRGTGHLCSSRCVDRCLQQRHALLSWCDHVLLCTVQQAV